MHKWFPIVCWFLVATYRATADDVRVDLTGRDYAQWSGLVEGRLDSGQMAEFRFPDGERGAYRKGFRQEHDGTRDWRQYSGLDFEVAAEAGREVEMTVTVLSPPGLGADERTSGKMNFIGTRRIYFSWDLLNAPEARTSWRKFVKGLDVSARYTDGKSGVIEIKSVHLMMAPSVALTSSPRGKSVHEGEVAEYEVTVGNPSPDEQIITLNFPDPGWHAMTAEVDPATFRLKSGESRQCRVRVTVPANLPPGAHETQILQAVGNGDASRANRMTFITGVYVPPPYLLHTAARWQAVRDKVENYPWARERQDAVVRSAEQWQVPEVAQPPANDPDDTWGPFLFHSTSRDDLMSCGIAWQLTRDLRFAEKAVLLLRRLSDPQSGYPSTLRATQPNQVQEGQFFQNVAMVYDMVKDSGLLKTEDRKRIHETLRLFMDTMERLADSGSINNWNVAEVTASFYCALAMQDLAAADRWFSGPSGICDQLRIGTMDDGWWYECSVAYNTWVATQFSQAAIAYQPWGFDFQNMSLPASFVSNVLLQPELNGGRLPQTSDPEQLAKPFGMDPDVRGPLHKPARRIKDLWDSMIPFIDWRGVMFGVNDSTENSVVNRPAGLDPSPFELAYYLYKDPAYASIIKRGNSRDLLYGVPELPVTTPEPYLDSAYADNAGIVMLRSHVPDRPIREQIQAVLHYGTHGWAHGHFDRTGLLSLMRYGRSFYNPEAVWHGYDRFLYKFYVQTSIAKNMVVVDRKNQEATPGERLLFHSGKMMQAAVVETTARWSYPPYGGMVYDYIPVTSFEEKAKREGRYMVIPDDAPGYGEMTGFTEPIRQRRLMLVMDDYILLADDLEGSRPHEFENLFQMKGFLGLDAPEKKFLGHTAQWDTDPLGGAQFVTDCDRYAVTAPAVARFKMRFGKGADNAGTRTEWNEDGVLKLDVHTLWPLKQEIMLGTMPEDHRTGQPVDYVVQGNGKALAEGSLGAWMLGKEEIDVPVAGIEELRLETRAPAKRSPSLFWGSARIVTADGREIPLSKLKPLVSNIRPVKIVNLDYREGPVKIQGEDHPIATPAQPLNPEEPGIVTLDLRGLDAVKFKATIGSDFLQGNEAQRRKTMAVKAARGTGARFITLVEPYEMTSAVKHAVAVSDSMIRVELTDGRIQEITIHDLSGQPAVEVVESKDGMKLRRDSTISQSKDKEPEYSDDE